VWRDSFTLYIMQFIAIYDKFYKDFSIISDFTRSDWSECLLRYTKEQWIVKLQLVKEKIVGLFCWKLFIEKINYNISAMHDKD
jgi:hypothetical protein